MLKIIYFIPVALSLFACNNNDKPGGANSGECNVLKARLEIENVIRQTKDCNQRKDIDCFMKCLDSSFILESNEVADKDRTISKDTIRKDILRDWSIIAK